MQNTSKITRLAPTPSGFLHLGNVFSFLITRLLADQHGLKVLLRIDDLDRARFREEYLSDIFFTLDLLGLEYDSGPDGVNDFHKNWSQSHRIDDYKNALRQLRNQNALFACRCSRKEIKQNSSRGIYPATCLSKNLDFDAARTSWRYISSGKEFAITDWEGEIGYEKLPESMEYFVLRRKDHLPAYQLASVVDDLKFGITHIVRGQDLWTSTLAQLDLAARLDSNFAQCRFMHHPLLKSVGGEKLSKSQASPSASEMLKSKTGKEEVFKLFSHKLNLNRRYRALPELREALSSGEEILTL